MIGIVKRHSGRARYCFAVSDGIDYFISDPYRKWADGDVVTFIPGQGSRGAVAKEVQIVRKGGWNESRETTS